MNSLAHIYLSGSSPEIQIGNFIADSIKGNPENQRNILPDGIIQGIIIHRHIDAFTDSHEIVKKTIVHFRPAYAKYAGVVVDMVYDHYLALHWKNYHADSLDRVALRFYNTLVEHFQYLPKNVKHFLPFFIGGNRLTVSQTLSGLELALNRMSQFSSLPDKTTQGMETVHEFYKDIEIEFFEYFDILRTEISNKYGISGIAPDFLNLQP